MYFIKLFSFLGKQLLNKRIVYFATMPRYLNQSEAINIDVELFNDYHFKVEQLMELAGLSVASVIQEVYPDVGKVLICVGPGNNGGDGLVAARHLKLFGYSVEIFIPKYPSSNNTLFSALSKQCEFFEIPFLQECPDTNTLTLKYQLIVDALFGFSFKPPVRPEFKNIMESLANSSMTVPVCSIDIPSGWDVEKGPLGQEYLKPETLVSLTAPKLCALHLGQFVKHHFLGGRFIPEKLEKKYSLDLPVYPSSKCYVRL